ncbi:MAG TPA: hypothetical protein PKD83_08795 [Ignavibacteria bacterium]|nr:hypothetical protein [Ignavibacteria bacterium]
MPEITYVSSSTIQMYPYSVDLFERNITESVSGDYGYGISVRKKFFSQNIAFGVSVQFLKITDSDNLTQTFSNDTLTVRARVTEELSVVPLEFKGYFNLPDFTEDLSLFLGGGLGIYYGDRKRTVLNVVSSTVSKNPGISLIVLTGMELSFTKNLSAVFEIEFRQAEYSVSSRYPVSEIKINGTIYDLEQELNSKIFVDGLKLCLGLSYNF